ncbi:hypothetical protein FB45DRAFT_872944 [Roridomyces roridus]|uniref:Zn(2)-C6 fungal-type domain-containing protein n=1 Tax=Roridomyces roridus TaxID=1738132 RepID=A0AAD7FF63_9AGAR|nr:hypothetical protein FB45DRAFT_872944 [Roridomyces roridus]
MQSQLDNAPTSTGRMRRFVACTRCRQRKIKCVSTSVSKIPDTACERCARKKFPCSYVSVAEQYMHGHRILPPRYAPSATPPETFTRMPRSLGTTGGWPGMGEQFFGMGLAQPELLTPTPASFHPADSQSHWASPYTTTSTVFDCYHGQYPIDYAVNAQAGPEYYATSPPTSIPTNAMDYPFVIPEKRLDELDMALLGFGFNDPNVYAGTAYVLYYFTRILDMGGTQPGVHSDRFSEQCETINRGPDILGIAVGSPVYVTGTGQGRSE